VAFLCQGVLHLVEFVVRIGPDRLNGSKADDDDPSEHDRMRGRGKKCRGRGMKFALRLSRTKSQPARQEETGGYRSDVARSRHCQPRRP
jgi:hypothetical protein